MTTSFPFAPTPTFSTLRIGERFSGRLTVTDSHLVLAVGIFADFAPVYTDDEFAMATRHKARVLPASLVAGVMAGVLGKALGRSLLGSVDQHVRFASPVVPGDTLTTEWEVVEKTETPDSDAGIVTCRGTCVSRDGTVVAEQELQILVAR